MAATLVPDDIDCIVVGGGLAGLVVAARLSEDSSKNVLVIEAGSNRKGDLRIDTPGLMVSMYDDPDFDWMHMSVPQVSVPCFCQNSGLQGGSVV
jgi:choline dehydrogenase-like flavoprotein